MQGDQRATIEELRKLIEEAGKRMMDPERMMSTDEVAELCGVHRQEILRFTKLGLPYYQIGKGFRFKRNEVLLFLEKFKAIEEAA
jgi:excisionase family DNA binding protein